MQAVEEKRENCQVIELRRLQGEELVKFYQETYPEYRDREYYFRTIGDHEYLFFKQPKEGI